MALLRMCLAQVRGSAPEYPVSRSVASARAVHRGDVMSCRDAARAVMPRERGTPGRSEPAGISAAIRPRGR